MFKSSSYKLTCCADGCYWIDDSTPEQPCWGKVKAIDEISAGEDGWWVHACQGHINYDWTGNNKNVYIKEV